MGWRDFEVGDLVYVFEHMLGAEGRPVMEAEPKLTPWIGDAEQALAALKAPGPKPVATGDPEAGKRLDRRAEGSVRVFWYLFSAFASLAAARGDEEAARDWTELRGWLFPEGLAFLGAAWQVQVGETSTLLDRFAALDPSTALTGLSLDGAAFGDLTSLCHTANEALRAHTKAPKPAPAEGPSAWAARNAAVKLLGDLEPSWERTFADPAKAAAKEALLGPILARKATVDAKSKPSSPKAPQPAPPAPAPADGNGEEQPVA